MPLDRQVSHVRLLIQVKTTRGGPSDDIKLDIAGRASKEPLAWFFVFAVLDARDAVSDLFVVPVDTSVMERTLRRLRR